LSSRTPSQELRIRLTGSSVHLNTPDGPVAAPPPVRRPPDPPPAPRTDLSRLRRRQISHDIHHELGTIMLLASLVSTAGDVGESSRHRARLILGETRWLDQLQLAYEAAVEQETDSWPAPPPTTRLDLVATEVVEAVRMATMTKIRVRCDDSTARIDRLTFWRAFRNVVDNAVRAAGPDGHVTVEISERDGWVVTQVDDDGPGFGAVRSGSDSLGLGIVRGFAAAWGGHLEIRRGELGGCCVRLRMRAAACGY
jgi:signal transduction histidine kinase